jgi:mRNA-degrading endonuclease RelE of RelBE toxin-antitoxin system
MRETICEIPSYQNDAKTLFTESEHNGLIDYLSMFPRSGDLIVGTGGVRKLRWARGGRGKSAGARVVYYFHDSRIPLYLLAVFGKNDKVNLSKDERNELAKLVDILVDTALSKEKND